MESPTSSVASFGATIVGPKFTWSEQNPDTDETIVHEFRARGGIPYDDVLAFRALGAKMRTEMSLYVRALRQHESSLDGAESEDRPIDDLRAEFAELSEQAIEHEKQRWATTIEQTLILVHPPHRAALRPLLEVGDHQQVNLLRAWLHDKVLGVVEQTVEEDAHVDPTLPPPPPDSARTGDGGLVSDETDQDSTD